MMKQLGATGRMLLLTAVLVGSALVVDSLKVETSADAMMYLTYYGYMNPTTSTDGTFMTEEDMKKGICHFQYMANITETCEINDETMAMMNLPRCGMPDVVGHSLEARRRRRYSLGSRWSRTDLTYRIDSFTPDLAQSDIVSTIADAFKVWSDVSTLTFRRVTGNTQADIVINFYSRDHGDGAPFDGASGVLAHAFFPENGRSHFDEDENWTIETFSGINLFQVAAHEFGHNLGLGHSNIEQALMAPFYRGYVPNFELHEDDIAGIQAHYGVNSGEPDVTMAPNPAACTGKVNAVTTTHDRSTYIFEGSSVWKFQAGTSSISEGFPKSIESTFPGLPDDIDAALYYRPNGRTYFFKGSQYWRYYNEAADAGYPRDIGSNWVGLPDDLDAAFVWSGNGRIYFVKGDQYYRFNGRVDAGYPRPLSVWRIPGNQVGAAVQWTNYRTYFFTSSGTYYRFNDRSFGPDSGYPRDVATLWQGCTNELQVEPESGSACGLVPSLIAVIVSSMVAFFY